jgi:hypothetical protein
MGWPLLVAPFWLNQSGTDAQQHVLLSQPIRRPPGSLTNRELQIRSPLSSQFFCSNQEPLLISAKQSRSTDLLSVVPETNKIVLTFMNGCRATFLLGLGSIYVCAGEKIWGKFPHVQYWEFRKGTGAYNVIYVRKCNNLFSHLMFCKV